MKRFCLAVALFGVGFAAAVQAAPQRVALGEDLVLGGGAFSNGGGITVAVEPRRTTEGMMAICGVWAQSERLSVYVRQNSREVLAPGTLAVDGSVVHHDLRVFEQVAPNESYAGLPAHCIATGLAWREGAQIEIRIPRRVVVRENNSEGQGFNVRFVPRVGENPALGSGSLLPTRWTRFLSGGGRYGSDGPQD